MLRPALAVLWLGLAIAACDRAPPAVVAEPVRPTEGAATPPPSSATPVPFGDAADAQLTDAAPPARDWPAEFAWPDGYTPPVLWEQKRVVIDGVAETWSLQWRNTPHFNGCEPSQGCACMGLDWGLVGDLDLVRDRPGAPTERLDLARVHSEREPRFEGQGPGEAYASIPGFQRTPRDNGDYDARGNELRPTERRMTEIVKRPHVEVMKLRDYDHDGLAAEFVFSVGYLACGQNPSVLVGVSRDNMHLHAFGVTMVYPWEWDRILAARGPSVDVELHVCGDHGGGGDYGTVAFDSQHGMKLVDDPKWECDFDDKKGFVKRRAKPK